MLAGRELYPELHARPVEALLPVPRDKENACMPTTIDRKTLERLVAEGAQLVEVLPLAEYEQEHLPRATSLPLRRLTAETASTLRKNVPVITYCGDGT